MSASNEKSNEIFCEGGHCCQMSLSKRDKEMMEELRGFEVEEFMDKNYCWDCALAICWEQMGKLSEENNTDGWRGWNAGFDMIIDMGKCKERCKRRGMMGRSWWKNLGYNSRCSCAWEDLREQEYKKEMEELRNE